MSTVAGEVSVLIDLIVIMATGSVHGVARFSGTSQTSESGLKWRGLQSSTNGSRTPLLQYWYEPQVLALLTSPLAAPDFGAQPLAGGVGKPGQMTLEARSHLPDSEQEFIDFTIMEC